MHNALGVSLVVFAACGSSTPETTVDAPSGSVDARPGPGSAVRVTVTRDTHTVAGLTVYFLEADDSVVATAITDAAGEAIATLHAGGSVTVVEPSTAVGEPYAFGLETWLAVQPGDDLALELPAPPSLTSFDLTVSADATPNISGYSVLASCGGEQVSAGVAHPFQLSSCIGARDATDFVVFAMSAQGKPTDALVALDTPVANSHPVTLTGAYAPVGSIAVTYSNVPARFGNASIDARLATSHGGLPAWNSTLTFAGGTGIGTVAWPAQLTTGTQLVSTSLSDSGQLLVGWGPIAPAITLDVASHVQRSITSAPIVDVANNRISWDVGADGAVPDVSLFTLGLDHGVQHRFLWKLIAPGSETALALPHLPSDLDTFRLASGDEFAESSVSSVLGPAGADYRSAILGPDGLDAKLGVVAGSVAGVVSIATLPGAPL